MEIKQEKNKFFYLKNETNSKTDFRVNNKTENKSVFTDGGGVELNEKDNSELNNYSLISKFVDYMELVEKKKILTCNIWK